MNEHTFLSGTKNDIFELRYLETPCAVPRRDIPDQDPDSAEMQLHPGFLAFPLIQPISSCVTSET